MSQSEREPTPPHYHGRSICLGEHCTGHDGLVDMRLGASDLGEGRLGGSETERLRWTVHKLRGERDQLLDQRRAARGDEERLLAVDKLARARGLAEAIAEVRPPYPPSIDGVRDVASEIVTLLRSVASPTDEDAHPTKGEMMNPNYQPPTDETSVKREIELLEWAKEQGLSVDELLTFFQTALERHEHPET
jgi:hypothetical protein